MGGWEYMGEWRDQRLIEKSAEGSKVSQAITHVNLSLIQQEDVEMESRWNGNREIGISDP